MSEIKMNVNKLEQFLDALARRKKIEENNRKLADDMELSDSHYPGAIPFSDNMDKSLDNNIRRYIEDKGDRKTGEPIDPEYLDPSRVDEGLKRAGFKIQEAPESPGFFSELKKRMKSK
jgi:hypothetical protein